MKTRSSAGGFHSLLYTLKAFMQFGFFRYFKAMLSKNACKTCALGMGGQKGGMRNELGRFPEVCKKSIQAMKSDLQKPIAPKFFAQNSIESLKKLSPRELESLGRLSTPLYADDNATHLQPIDWNQALEKVARKLKQTEPQRSFFYFSGRSSNEAGFLLQLLARQYGTNHVNNCSFYCHQASGVGLSTTVGNSCATVNLQDVENCDLFFLIGANPSSNHPRLMTSLSHQKKQGGKVIVINPVKEPGLVRFKIPSHPISLFFGTKISDLYVQPNIGGDLALISGLAKEIFKNHEDKIDSDFINTSTQGFESYKKSILSTSWKEITTSSGVSREKIKELTEYYIQSNKTIFAWAMGLTHQLHGTQTIQAIANLALLRGMVGKKNAGLLPLRGHSNVQGMGTMGVTPEIKEEVLKNLSLIGLNPPTFKGYDTMACMEASARQEMDFAFCLGGNLYASNPDSKFATSSLSKVGMITYLNTTLNSGHLFGRGKEVLILPVLARDEEAQATTQESMFSYIRFSQGGPGRIKLIKSEVDIIATLGEKLFDSTPLNWQEFRFHKNIRSLIAKTIPNMEAIEKLDQTRAEFTIPKRMIHTHQFATPSGKAQFQTTTIPQKTRKKDHLTLMTVRSEGQFNTVVFEEEDTFRGIERRDVILLHPEDIKKYQLKENQKVTVKSDTGELSEILIRPFNIKQGQALMYYPETNVLIDRKLDPLSKTPAFKSVEVQILPH